MQYMLVTNVSISKTDIKILSDRLQKKKFLDVLNIMMKVDRRILGLNLLNSYQ